MSEQYITDDLVEEALKYLATNSEPAAAAKAERVRAEEGIRQAKARAILKADGAVAIREAHAIASDDYALAVERYAQSVKMDEWHRNQRNKADAIIEAWRTFNANKRAGSNFR